VSKLDQLPDKKDLLNSITLAKNGYFMNVVDKNGKFIYSYLPRKNKIQKKYNILRHAGTIYSMLEIYEIMPDEELLKEAKKAILFLLSRIRPVEINGVNAHVVVERDINKLGGSGLAKYISVTGDKQYLPIMQSLAEWMRETQDETGNFTIHKQHYSSGEITDFISRFYPGEAILALVRLYHHDKDDRWLDVAEKATNYLIKIRDKGTTVNDITPDHWLLYAINDLYRHRRKKHFVSHAFLMCRNIFNRQIINNKKNPEWNGGYIPKKSPPKSTPAACYSEGLGAAFNLAHDFGYLRMSKQIKKTIANGVAFQLRSQVLPETTKEMENLLPYIGAFQKSITQTEIRIDYTQHNISGIIQFYKILVKSRSNIKVMFNKIFPSF